MPTSWADSIDKVPGGGMGAVTRVQSTYVPPHLRNRPPSSDPPAAPSSHGDAASGNYIPGHGGSSVGSGHPSVYRNNCSAAGGHSGGWNNRSCSWDCGREREVNPFSDNIDSEEGFGTQENTGINFDAYEDIPVETSGQNVPHPVNTFIEIDLGEALNHNIKRCKYVKPTPVQRYAIPISIAGRDLMACAQTGSGKTAAFCFPIISGIMRNSQSLPRPPYMPRMSFPFALILSPTRELSIQLSLFMKKPRNLPIKLV